MLASIRQLLCPRTTSLSILALTAALAGCAPSDSGSAAFAAAALADARPEDVGISSGRLARLDDAMQGIVDEGRLAGMSYALARHGRVVHSRQLGMRDLEAGHPMPEDAIFRIYSMSKPITGVGLMTLYEEGRFRLSDPVARYIPELANLRVVAGQGPNGFILEDTDHPITIRELMTHTAGFAYGLNAATPIDSIYREREVLDLDGTLEDMIDELAEIPLLFQPGSRWYYSVAVDIQGYLIEVLTGLPLDEFLRERLFEPLGMDDTGFWVPPEKLDRFAQVYEYDDETGALTPGEGFDFEGESPFVSPPSFLMGGGGLVSTTADYMRFCQMLLNGGELDGVRILAPLTVELMTRNQLPRGNPEMAPGRGFGLDFAVIVDPVAAEAVSEGEYSWGGAAGTWFWIDPAQDLAFVGMIQQFGNGRPDVASLSRRLVYSSILEPAAAR